MFFFFLAVPIALVLVYTVALLVTVPDFVEQRFGKLEELPPANGRWMIDTESDEALKAAQDGLLRETREWITFRGNWLIPARLRRQARYIDEATNRIARVEPEERFRIRRRLVRK